MKQTLFLLSLILAFNTINVQAQEFEPLDKSPLDVIFFPSDVPKSGFRGDYTPAKIKLYYSRPQLRGRNMMLKVANGKIWRLGANEANEITFYQDVTIGNIKVKAGTYSLFAEVSSEKWIFILHSKLNTWGSYTLSKGGKEIVRVEGYFSKSSKTIEALSMTFKAVEGGVHLVVGWQNTIAEMPIKM